MMAIVALAFGSLSGLITAISGWLFLEWTLLYALAVYMICGVSSLTLCATALALRPDAPQ